MQSDQPTADLYVRADAPVVERRNAVIERLQRLDREDRIAGFRVHAWPRAMSLDLDREAEADGTLDAVRAFESWAARQDSRVGLPFEVRTSRSSITGSSDELVVLPVFFVAASVDGALVGLAPCTAAGTAHTVGDVLDAIEAGDPQLPPRTDGPDPDREPPAPAEERETRRVTAPDREASAPAVASGRSASTPVGTPGPSEGER
ncbi:MAG: HTH domain-containing protein [Haloferacaceae archaeon]